MAAPVNTAPFSNLPPNTNVIDADAVNEKFDRLYNYLTAGVDTLAPKTVSPANLAPPHACWARQTGNVTLPTTGLPTPVPLAGAEGFDPTGMHDMAVNNNRITVARPGLYLVGFQTFFSAYGASCVAGIDKNGRWVGSGFTDFDPYMMRPTDTISPFAARGEWAVVLDTGDYVAIAARNPGGAAGVTVSAGELWATFIGPAS